MTTVIVSNIAPGTPDSTITEFFGFCGHIVQMNVENGQQELIAHITFETAAAASTSLLLSNAMIGDRPIKVEMDPNAPQIIAPTSETAALPTAPETEANEGDSLIGGNTVKAEPNQATHVIAKLIATGHKLSDDAMAKANELDERWQLSNRVNAGLSDLGAAINDFSNRIGIAETSKEYYNAMSAKVQSSGVGQSASQAASSTEQFFSGLARAASSVIQNAAETSGKWAQENVPTVIEKIRNVGDSVTAQGAAIRAEAHQIYPGAENLQAHDGTVDVPPAAAPQGTTE